MCTSIDQLDINTPDFTVYLKNIKESRELHGILRRAKVLSYAYAIKHKNSIMKIGESSDKATVYGSRLVRQVGNMPGFDEHRKSGSGKEMLSVVEDFEKLHGITVHKDDCSVMVWNVSGVKTTSFAERKISLQAEDSLVTQHEKINGCLPPGNYLDTRPRKLQGHVRYSDFDKLFDIIGTSQYNI